MKRMIECCDWCHEPLDFQPMRLRQLRLDSRCFDLINDSPKVLGRELMFAGLAALSRMHGTELPRLDLHESVTHRRYNERQKRSVRLDERSTDSSFPQGAIEMAQRCAEMIYHLGAVKSDDKDRETDN